MPQPPSFLSAPVLALALVAAACGTPEDRAAEHVAAATTFYRSGDFLKARSEAQIAIQVAPKNLDARYLLAELARRNGDIGQMLGHLEVIVGEDRTELPSRLKMASLLLDGEDYEAAASLAAQARRLAPGNPEVQLLNARVLLRTGSVATAIQELDAVLAREPANAPAARLRGVVLAESDPERGLADLDGSIARIGGEAAVPLRQARIAILRGLGRTEAAEKAAAALAAGYPSATAAAAGAGTGPVAPTRAELDGVLQDRPDDVPALLARAELNLDSGQYDDALADLRRAVRKAPGSERALRMLITVHLRRGNRTLAADACHRLLETRPMDTAASLQLADIYRSQQQPDDAERLYRQVLLRMPASEPALAGLVSTLLDRREWAAAAAVARTAESVTRTPGFGPVLAGNVLLAQRLFTGAEADFARALREAPASDEALAGLAAALAGKGEVDRVEELLARYLRAHPGSNAARVLRAANLFRQKSPAEARALLGQVLQEDPRQVPAWLALADGVPEQRISILEQALAANPANEQLELRLGRAYENAGLVADAGRIYEGALARDPDAALPANALARLLLEDGQDAASYQRALDLTQRFASSHNPQLLHTLGLANYRGGDARAAVRYLEQALAAGSDDAILRYHLGLAYLAADNRSGARQQLERALNLTSEFPGAADARATLRKLGA